MTKLRKSRSFTFVIAASALLALTLAVAYVAGYFVLGPAWRPGPGPGPHAIRMRVFPDSRIATLYQPAAWIESRIRGYDIVAGDEELHYMSSP